MVLFEDRNGNEVVEEISGQPENSEVLQRQLYYPFGLALRGPMPQQPSPAQDYRYNGKERLPGSEIYAYGFRHYDPTVGRFLGVDPLASEFPSWSPYSYTFNNPIRYIDPDGRAPEDIIDIDKKTGSISVTKAAGDDVVRLVDGENIIDSYTYGDNGSFLSENSVFKSEGSYFFGTSTIIKSNNSDNAEKLFKFAANSDVEFGMIDTKEEASFITTSYEEAVTSSLPGLVKALSKMGYTGERQIHSHPGTITSYNESIPSGHYDYDPGNPNSVMPYLRNGRKEGDALNAIQVRSLKGFGNTKFEVYAPGNNTTTTYDGVNRAKIRKN